MENLHLHLLGLLLIDNILPFKIPAGIATRPMLDILPHEAYLDKSSLYAGLMLALLAAGISTLFIKQLRDNRLQYKMEQLHVDIFTKIIHELRTPLTIILGLSKQLKEQRDLSNNSQTYLNAIERQGKYLSEMVNQLLDVANLQTGTKPVEWETGNIVAFLEMVSETFRIHAEQKGIELLFFSDEMEIEADFVPDFLNKIMYNLLSNAIKYNDEGSRVYLTLERNKKDRRNIFLRVIDHGKGIESDMLPHLFNMFYKCPDERAETPAGNGIGLAVVKHLTEALGWTVSVESEPGKGTTFTIGIPRQRSENQVYPRWKPGNVTVKPGAKDPEEVDQEEIFTSEINDNDPRATILVAEDNKDVALYIRSIFPREKYNILYASNGEKAWDIMNNTRRPDIVITDVIMPKKNGIELCKEIKTSPTLNLVPVIILSAKNKRADIMEGLKSGAEYYLLKPFHPEELQVRVEKLLVNRALIREKYHRTLLKEEKTPSSHIHASFLHRVTDIIYREMKNPDFTPTKLAGELAISVSQLNKRINDATGNTTSIYILKVRLYHAKKLLSTENKTIGEVAAACGIYDLNYFSRAFKKHNGITPTQFKRLPPKVSSSSSLIPQN